LTLTGSEKQESIGQKLEKPELISSQLAARS